MTINIIIIIIFIMFLDNRHRRLMKRETHILVLSTHKVRKYIQEIQVIAVLVTSKG